ncbi:hypothetical protein T265_04647 [Opisthorchis viverrini]|uniref:Uncharacterized protein n=1 Tax=Opisthorchis viverrini TaxID=6198 RepID=A0A075AG87_OPIVI|nr:hypothetical protein T265_04647 [Opisthorchis viverrini]KER28504.1 hypothetical protein T265_04647 [Opisthorchis viverrini]
MGTPKLDASVFRDIAKHASTAHLMTYIHPSYYPECIAPPSISPMKDPLTLKEIDVDPFSERDERVPAVLSQSEESSPDYILTDEGSSIGNDPFARQMPRSNISDEAAFLYYEKIKCVTCNVLLIRLLKIHRQPTTGFALLGANQRIYTHLQTNLVLLRDSPGTQLQHIQLPENIINERFSWVPGESDVIISAQLRSQRWSLHGVIQPLQKDWTLPWCDGLRNSAMHTETLIPTWFWAGTYGNLFRGNGNVFAFPIKHRCLAVGLLSQSLWLRTLIILLSECEHPDSIPAHVQP